MMTQHDAAVPGIDNPDPEPLAVEDGEEGGLPALYPASSQQV